MRTESDKWYNRIVRDSRYNDGRMKREIDPQQQYIDTPTLLGFQSEQENKCYYCQVMMNWLQRRSGKNGLTLERTNNDLPHYTSNCTGLVCKSCNSKKYSRTRGLLLRYFTKWRNQALDVRVRTGGERSPSFTN